MRERDRDRRDVRPRRDATLQLLVELDRAILVVADLFRVEPHRDEMLRVEAQVDVLRGRQRADEEARDDEQRERARNLAHDQQATEALTIDAVGVLRPPSCSAARASAREARHAGHSPIATPVTIAAASEKKKTFRSNDTSKRSGRSAPRSSREMYAAVTHWPTK